MSRQPSPTVNCTHQLWQKWVGLHFGRFFHVVTLTSTHLLKNWVRVPTFDLSLFLKFFWSIYFLKYTQWQYVMVLYIFFEALIFLKYTQWQYILSFDNSTAKYLRPKNLTPWRDSNQGSSVLEADAMTIMPCRQGSICHWYPRFCCSVGLVYLMYRAFEQVWIR
jgi:hypothetical protein